MALTDLTVGKWNRNQSLCFMEFVTFPISSNYINIFQIGNCERAHAQSFVVTF